MAMLWMCAMLVSRYESPLGFNLGICFWRQLHCVMLILHSELR